MPGATEIMNTSVCAHVRTLAPPYQGLGELDAAAQRDRQGGGGGNGNNGGSGGNDGGAGGVKFDLNDFPALSGPC